MIFTPVLPHCLCKSSSPPATPSLSTTSNSSSIDPSVNQTSPVTMSAIMNSLRPSLRSVAAGGYGRTFTTSSPRAVSKMILTGRLGAEPELQATSTGQEIVRYSVGCSHGRQADRRTSWFRVASFQTEGNQRDFLLGLQKG